MSDRPTPAPQDDTWSSNLGFVLAAIGSAVGLGNVWRFAYVAGENGGAAFLAAYAFYLLVLGLPLVLAETGLGRHARADVVGAVAEAAPGRGWGLGAKLLVVASVFVLGYYSLIAGWVLYYLTSALRWELWSVPEAAVGQYFHGFVASGVQPAIWQAATIVVCALVVAGGIQKGIERFSRLFVPLLGAMILGLALYAIQFEGAMAGVHFLFSPDWNLLLQPRVHLAAAGQAFFSLGVGLAIFVTYGAYLDRKEPLPRLAVAVVAGDTFFAIVAGLAIFPAVFAFGLNPAAGPGLVFEVLPQVFGRMPGGAFVGTAFFALLLLAAVTSMVSILEVSVAFVRRRYAWTRPVAVALCALAALAFGLPAALDPLIQAWTGARTTSLLTLSDRLVSHAILPLGGLFLALVVGWRWRKARALTAAGLGDGALAHGWFWSLRVLVPLLIVLMVAFEVTE